MIGLRKIEDLRQKIARLPVREYLQDAVIKEEEHITDFQRDQLSQGKRADGSTLPDYSPTSVEVFGKPAGPIKLHDTGDYYDAFSVDAFSDAFEINNSDDKAEKLSSDYGDVVGLTTTSKVALINQYLRPRMAMTIKSSLLW